MMGMLPPEQAGGPVRTCLGCGKRYGKGDMLRFVTDRSGLIRVDSRKMLPGRGAYCCGNYRCLESFVKKKGRILRSLRISKIDFSSVLSLADEYRLNGND